jgi:hypothetical protein
LYPPVKLYDIGLTSPGGHQQVIHRQEYPSAIDTYFLPMIETPIAMKIWLLIVRIIV